MSCTACGLSKPHKDKKKDCPAWSSSCKCGIKHHFHHICISDTQGCPQEATHKQEMEDYKAGSVEFNYNVERPDLVSQVGLSAGNSIPDAQPVTPWLMPAGDVLSMISTAELVFDNNCEQ